MSQQINLLKHRREALGPVLWGLGALAAVLAGLLAYGYSLHAEAGRLRETARAGERALAQAKASLQALHARQAAQSDGADLRAEIAALKPRAEAVRQLVDAMRSGSLGRTEGFAAYLSTLAGVSEEGLWVTSMAVDPSGKTVGVNGRALRGESVMRYARRLNEAFAPYQVQFNALELTPENLLRQGAAEAPLLSTVSFKLF